MSDNPLGSEEKLAKTPSFRVPLIKICLQGWKVTRYLIFYDEQLGNTPFTFLLEGWRACCWKCHMINCSTLLQSNTSRKNENTEMKFSCTYILDIHFFFLMDRQSLDVCSSKIQRILLVSLHLLHHTTATTTTTNSNNNVLWKINVEQQQEEYIYKTEEYNNLLKMDTGDDVVCVLAAAHCK